MGASPLSLRKVNLITTKSERSTSRLLGIVGMSDSQVGGESGLLFGALGEVSVLDELAVEAFSDFPEPCPFIR